MINSEPTAAEYNSGAIAGYLVSMVMLLLGVPFLALANNGYGWAWWIPAWMLWGPAIALFLYSITLDIRGLRKGRQT